MFIYDANTCGVVAGAKMFWGWQAQLKNYTISIAGLNVIVE